MIYYLMWGGDDWAPERDDIVLDHTEFAANWYFGLYKQLFKRLEWGASIT